MRKGEKWSNVVTTYTALYPDSFPKKYQERQRLMGLLRLDWTEGLLWSWFSAWRTLFCIHILTVPPTLTLHLATQLVLANGQWQTWGQQRSMYSHVGPCHHLSLFGIQIRHVEEPRTAHEGKPGQLRPLWWCLPNCRHTPEAMRTTTDALALG